MITIAATTTTADCAADVSAVGDIVLAATCADKNPMRALHAEASKPGHARAARELTHPLANPPGETEVTTEGGFGEDQ